MNKKLLFIFCIVVLGLSYVVFSQQRLIAYIKTGSPQERTISSINDKSGSSMLIAKQKQQSANRLFSGIQENLDMTVLDPSYLPYGKMLKPAKIEINNSNPEWYGVEYYPDGYGVESQEEPHQYLWFFGRYDPEGEWYPDANFEKSIELEGRRVDLYETRISEDPNFYPLLCWHEDGSYYSVSAKFPYDENSLPEEQRKEILTKLYKVVGSMRPVNKPK